MCPWHGRLSDDLRSLKVKFVDLLNSHKLRAELEEAANRQRCAATSSTKTLNPTDVARWMEHREGQCLRHPKQRPSTNTMSKPSCLRPTVSLGRAREERLMFRTTTSSLGWNTNSGQRRWAAPGEIIDRRDRRATSVFLANQVEYSARKDTERRARCVR